MAASSVTHSAIVDSKVDEVVSRIERLPISSWHVKARVIIGVATFFDAFDALAIAFVLPVLVPLWKLTSPQVGLMISVGYLGQLHFGLVSCRELVPDIDVLAGYLPAQLGDDELAALVSAAIAETGATGMKGMGQVMKVLTPRVAGRADGARVAAEVRRRLG